MATPRNSAAKQPTRKAVQPEPSTELAKLLQAVELLITELGELKQREADRDKRVERLWIKVM